MKHIKDTYVLQNIYWIRNFGDKEEKVFLHINNESRSVAEMEVIIYTRNISDEDGK